jgi:hypothetical protein
MRLAAATLWILIGGALSAGAYWAFLNTPESTVWTLIASAVVTVVFLGLLGATITGALAVWVNGLARASITSAVRPIPSIVPAFAIAAMMWWLFARIDTWVAMRSGQISAWFIAQLGWADVSWLFTAIRYIGLWFRWIVAALLAVSMMSGIMTIGLRALTQPAWLRRALRPRALVLATVWFVTFIAAPWSYLVPWRPAQLPATSVELFFIIAKLSLSAILFAIGAALIIREAAGVVPPPREPKEAAQAA